MIDNVDFHHFVDRKTVLNENKVLYFYSYVEKMLELMVESMTRNNNIVLARALDSFLHTPGLILLK